MNQTDSHSDIERLLGTGDDSRDSRLWLRRSLWVAVAVLVIFTTFLLLHGSRGSKDVVYITNTVTVTIKAKNREGGGLCVGTM